MKRDRKTDRQTGRDKLQQKKSIRGISERDSRQHFPGYPHYPAQEDIMSAGSGMERIRLNMENITPSTHTDGRAVKQGPGRPPGEAEKKPTEKDPLYAPASDDDIRKEEIRLPSDDIPSPPDTETEPPNASPDQTDDDGDPLHENDTADYFGGELDVPGSEDDDAGEDIGEEDEENNYYSLSDDNDRTEQPE